MTPMIRAIDTSNETDQCRVPMALPTPKPFNPPFWMRVGIVQTALASFRFRKRVPNAMLDAAEDVVLECEDGVQLKGSFSRAPQNKALAIFLHGWEGSQGQYLCGQLRTLYVRTRCERVSPELS